MCNDRHIPGGHAVLLLSSALLEASLDARGPVGGGRQGTSGNTVFVTFLASVQIFQPKIPRSHYRLVRLFRHYGNAVPGLALLGTAMGERLNLSAYAPKFVHN